MIILKITLDPALAAEKYEKSGVASKQEIYCIVKCIKHTFLSKDSRIDFVLESAFFDSDEIFIDPEYIEVTMRGEGATSLYAAYSTDDDDGSFSIDLPCLIEQVDAFPDLYQFRKMLSGNE